MGQESGRETARAAESTVGPAAAADCGESNGINKADSELSDKARCDSWTITNVRGSSKTARAVFIMYGVSTKGNLKEKGSFACQCRRRPGPVTGRLGWPGMPVTGA